MRIASTLLSIIALSLLLVVSIEAKRALRPPGFRPSTMTPKQLDTCHRERVEKAIAHHWPADTYKPMDQIDKHLWVGSICAALNAPTLRQQGIGMVVSMASEWPTSGSLDNESDEVTGEPLATIYYTRFHLEDSGEENDEHVLKTFEKVYQRIKQHWEDPGNLGKSVLIYCNMGVSRSVSAIMYVLHRVQEDNSGSRMNTRELLESIREIRPIARPNPQYMRLIQSKFDLDGTSGKDEL